MSQIQHHQTQSIKEQIYKLDFIKIKNDCALKDTLKEMKRQATDRREIFAEHRSFLGLASRAQKECSELNNDKTTQLKNRQKV